MRIVHGLAAMRPWVAVPVIVLAVLGLPSTGSAGESTWTALASPKNAFDLWVLKADEPLLSMAPIGWGPNWRWAAPPVSTAAAGDNGLNLAAPFTIDAKQGQVITLACRAHKTGERSVEYRYTLTADKDVALTMLALGFAAPAKARAGTTAARHLVATLADGTEKQLAWPVVRGPLVGLTTKLAFTLDDGQPLLISLNPACTVGLENGQLRLMLAADTFPKGMRTIAMTVTAPAPLDFAATPAAQARYVTAPVGPDWFAFAPTSDNGPSVIGMIDWLDKPAGKHGGVRLAGDAFQFEDGTPVKFWGVNLAFGGNCAPEKAIAEATAARFAKYGVNAVRLHKFCGPGWEGMGDPNDGTKLTSNGLARLDYFCAQLRDRGIYYGFSHSFGYQIRPGNRDRILAYDEIAKGLKGNTYGLINVAEDLQDLMIEMVVNLLRHPNPHTGHTYADDPALSYIELQNEDDVFFYSFGHTLDACPTYRKQLNERFAAWVQARYGSPEALAKAWAGAFRSGETATSHSLAVDANPWFMGSDHLPSLTGSARQRMLDNAAFLHDAQNRFYAKFAKAIRDAGYKGPLCGSPWQAPAMLPHYYNLRSDALVGFIDRHNYFGDGLTGTMLSQPGSGYLGTGLQQVSDRPFGISEWIHVYPDLYSAEGPAIMAAYGLGLQGWDESYEFQCSARAGFANIVGSFAFGVWDADVPTQLGQYPALARMIYRGDVKEGEVVSRRRVSLPELQEGRLAFSDRIEQSGDIKKFGGDCPPAALAAGRCVVEFTDKPGASTFPDMTRFETNRVITSTTKQLVWDHSDKGLFTVDTAGTKAVVGFAGGRSFTLGNVTIALQCPYASVFLTALDKEATLANAQHALVSALARNANTGFKVLAADDSVLSNGTAPIMLEPVKATIAIKGREIASVTVLDHDGRRTDRTIAAAGDTFAIDGARDKALYYEVVFR